tara:strand:+ start:264 stop:605 length:342 start_codon:yes stop_codon:yes gene_type:complete
MILKPQRTSLNRNVDQLFTRLDEWTVNPWRRYSFLLIVLFISFLFGTSIGTINGVLALMDPLGAFLAVLLLEIMIRIRRHWPSRTGYRILLNIIDTARIGFLYGLLMEGFKLL